jgi:hypothetical protein
MTIETAATNALEEIARNLRTQDNRATAAPIFIVQQRRRIFHVEEGDGFEWYETDEWDQVDDRKAAKLERHFHTYSEEPKGYSRVAYLDVWEFVTACFTEQGCKDYIAINGHNLQSPRVYAEGSWRNAEWNAVRDYLLSLDAATPCPPHVGEEGRDG